MEFKGANYIGQMDYIVERINNPPRLVQCIQAYNEKDFIGYTLGSIYDEVDRIIVLEGAVENRIENNSFHSSDGTIEIIEDFIENEDKDNKVTYIPSRRAYKSLEHLKQTFLTLVSDGDIVVINDCDEIYKPEDIRRIRRAFDLKPQASEIIPLFLHFYRDWGHIRVPRYDNVPQHQRVFKYQRGMKYASHPVVLDANGIDTCLDWRYQPRRFILDNFYIWHYGMARPEIDDKMRGKLQYYRRELKKFDAVSEFEKKAEEFLEKAEAFTEIAKYPKEKHPRIMHEHPMFNYVEDRYDGRDIQLWTDVSPYKEAMNGKDYGNIWIWMQPPNPRYPMFHNEIKIPCQELVDAEDQLSC